MLKQEYVHKLEQQSNIQMAAECSTLYVILPPYDEPVSNTNSDINSPAEYSALDVIPPPDEPVSNTNSDIYSPAEYSALDVIPPPYEPVSNTNSDIYSPAEYSALDVIPPPYDETNPENTIINGDPTGSYLWFITSFLLSFAFGYIMVLLCFCFSKSVAGKTGSISGYGAFFIRKTIYYSLLAKRPYDDYIYGLFVLFGSFMFFAGIIRFYQAKSHTV
jgi:hypothetical protein